MSFLTLAYEHDAFDIKPEELFCATLDRSAVEVLLKDAVLDTPLFRAAGGTGSGRDGCMDIRRFLPRLDRACIPCWI